MIGYRVGRIAALIGCLSLMLLGSCGGGDSTSAREKLLVAEGATATTALVNPDAPAADADGVQTSRTQAAVGGGAAQSATEPSSPATVPPATSPPNRTAIFSYNNSGGSTRHSEPMEVSMNLAQSFVAKSNVITQAEIYVAGTVGSGSFPLRLSTIPLCTGDLLGRATTVRIQDSGSYVADFGDVSVAVGATYWLCWTLPPGTIQFITGQSESLVSLSSPLMLCKSFMDCSSKTMLQAKVVGYNR